MTPMTPINRSTRHTQTQPLFSKQYYLSPNKGDLLFGYFLWNGSVVVVGFDGSRPDSLQRIKENSVCELLTVDAARVHWTTRNDSGYTAYATCNPSDQAALTHISTVQEIAVAFIKKQQKIATEKTHGVQNTTAKHTNYALEA